MPRSMLLPSVVSALLLISACTEGPVPEAIGSNVVRLSEVFKPEQVENRVEVIEPERSEWLAAEADSSAWTWRAVTGLAGARLEAGAVRATTGTDWPLFELVAPEPMGQGDVVYALELRMRVSAGTDFQIAALDEDDPPAEAFVKGGEPPIAMLSPVKPGDEATTYRLELTRNLPLGPFGRRNPQRIVVRPTDVADAEVAIESVRVIFRQEHLAAVDSGLGWHGLGEVWRETLVSRPGETLNLPLEVPAERPVLDLAVGTPVDLPVTFTAEVGGRETRSLIRRTVTTADRWEGELVDLTPFAGREIELRLRIEAEDPTAVGLWGSGVVAARGAGPAAAADRPQGVILVIADTLRRDHLDAWGYERETAPTLTRLGREGVRFADTVTQAVWTKVSVPSILSGLYPDTHGIVDIPDRLPASATTLAEAFRGAGYATMATSSWAFTGQLSNLHQGVDELWEGRSVVLPDGASDTKTARFYFDRALDFVERHRERPFLVVLHLGDPHSPYEPLGRYAELWAEPGSKERHDSLRDEIAPKIESTFFRFNELPQQVDLEREGYDLEWWRDHEIDWYDGSIRGLDAELQRFVDRLEHLELTDDVVLTFASDHGEEFFEHGNNWHGTNLYGHQTDVPLVMWGPGFLPAGVVVEPTVQTIDVLPTLLELAGIEIPERVQGRSLLPAVEAVAAGEAPSSRGFRPAPAFVRHVLAGDSLGFPDSMLGRARAVITPEWRLVHHLESSVDRPEFELFARADDPLSLNDVAGEHPDVVATLSAQLENWASSIADQKLEAESTGEMSTEELERLRALGYL